MANHLRSGNFGEYWSSYYNETGSLTENKKKVNATYIYNYLSSNGWTVNAIAGLLGNMERESYINPGCWQSGKIGNTGVGYSLVQWTPATKYINWLPTGSDPSEMDNALSRIIYELNNHIQWIKTNDYPLTFQEFTISTQSPEYLARAFCRNYERPGSPVYSIREKNARKWYNYLGGLPPIISRKNKFKWVLFTNKIRNRG